MLFLLGVNHVSAPLPFRERLAFPDADLEQALKRLVGIATLEEGMIISTCNRVEVLVRASEGGAGSETLNDFLARERGVSREEIQRYTYHYRGRDAVRHLFQVASGLDSMILGEPQILGQIKQAYLTAHAAGTTGPILDRLLQQGLAVAKRVRTETGISRHAVSIAFAAVELAKKIFERLDGRSALLLGAGKMSELAAQHLAANGVRLVVSSRTYDRAARLAERLGGEVVNWDDALSHLSKVDIVVSGTAAPQIILGTAQVKEGLRGRRGAPLFLIDMAVPRDIDPAVNLLNGVYLYDIDDLQGVVDSNLEERNREAEMARRMIEGEIDAFEGWRSSLEITPTIVALRRTLLDMGRHELERHRKKLAGLSSEQQRAVEELTRSLVQKVLHRPIVHLKSSAESGQAGPCASLYRKIFGISAEAIEAAERREADPAPAEQDEAPQPGPRRVLPGGRGD